MTEIVLPRELYSPDLVNLAILELDRFISQVRTSSAAGKAMPAPSSGLGLVFDALQINPKNLQELESLKNNLDQLLNSAQVVNIILPQTASNNIKYLLSDWFRKNIGENILLNFSARSDVGGGAIIQAGSRIYDFSFKKVLLANKTRISGLANV